jgi:hypothetical protein
MSPQQALIPLPPPAGVRAPRCVMPADSVLFTMGSGVGCPETSLHITNLIASMAQPLVSHPRLLS